MKRNLYRNLLWIVFLAGAMACGGEKKKSEKEIGGYTGIKKADFSETDRL